MIRVSWSVLGQEGAAAYSFFLGSQRRIPFHKSERGELSSAGRLSSVCGADAGSERACASGSAGADAASAVEGEAVDGGGDSGASDAVESAAVAEGLFFGPESGERGGAVLNGSLSIVAHHLPPGMRLGLEYSSVKQAEPAKLTRLLASRRRCCLAFKTR